MFEFFLSPIFHFPKKNPKSISCIFRKKAVILHRNSKHTTMRRTILILMACLAFATTQAQDISPVRSNIIIKNVDVYYLGDRTMTEDQYLRFIRTNCVEAWNSYQKGCRIWKAGWSLLGIGAGSMTAGILTASFGIMGVMAAAKTPEGETKPTQGQIQARNIYYAGLGLLGGGFVVATASIPCLVVGHKKRNHSHDIYNTSCARPVALELNLQTTSNGIGLSMNF